METGKTTRYLKYAIGEIILVVIGILIALSINNWNEQRKENEQAVNFLKRLVPEMESNIDEINKNIARVDTIGNSARALLNMFHEPNVEDLNKEEINRAINNVLKSTGIDLKMETLSEGINNGSVALIPSDTLRNRLYSWRTMVEDIQHSEAINNEDLNSYLVPFLYDNFNWRQMDYQFSSFEKDTKGSAFNTEFRTIFLSQKFENLIDNRYFYNYKIKEDFEALLSELKETKSVLLKTLEAND
ncbi:DUF6090 family protein [Winogradskyella sp.]|uniref:DUF6090 family protein n=1 Tax=unclassified Winogradskyella TaxID=2615021 RepID=UPI001B1A17D8|nr:DUF6090 family protein [Winogradskyella sp.]MBO6879524.1 hypothetical protein [Winogradskyella sp.]